MNVSFASSVNATDALIVLVYDKGVLSPGAAQADKATDGAITRAIAASRFSGKPAETLVIVAPSGVEAGRVVLLGVGAADKVSDAGAERAGAVAVRAVLMSGAKSATLHLDAPEVAPNEAARAGLGGRLAAYRFDAYRTKLSADKKPSLTSLTIVSSDADAARAAWPRYEAVADGVAMARDLVGEPANVLHPEEFAQRCKGLEADGLKVEILGEAEMEKLGMGALLGVGQGSRKQSQIAIMTWNGAGDATPIAFVGKGVTFDAGGISLKPGEGMWDMKADMGGAAAVTGLMKSLGKRKAKVNAVGVVALVENMPDGDAQRPGDIVTSMSGQTIEVLNTDAEGRLVLADALWYVKETIKPTAIIDLATLTGAMVIALAHEYGGLFSNNDELAGELLAASEASEEKLWRMPMGSAYDKMIDSKNADMKNIGGRAGGSITAAQFLKRFVGDVPWAHLDIAPTAWKDKSDDPREPTWATGWGVRVLDRFVADTRES